MNTAGFTSPFAPPEVIEACGWRARRLTPRTGTAPEPPTGLCPFAAALAAATLDANVDAVILAPACDQMRRIPDRFPAVFPPVFQLHVPAVAASPNAGPFLASEFRRLGAFLARHGGREPDPDDLHRAIARFQSGRRALGARLPFFSAASALKTLLEFPGSPAPDDPLVPVRGGAPVMVLGGPLTPGDAGWMETAEQTGLRIVVPAYEQGPRTWPAEIDPGANDPWRALADAYLRIPDVFQRPADALKRWINEQTARHSLRGLILVSHRWCDLWTGEFARVKAETGLPSIEIAAGAVAGFDAARTTRIEALAETLRTSEAADAAGSARP